jgi:hypothetical protein
VQYLWRRAWALEAPGSSVRAHLIKGGRDQKLISAGRGGAISLEKGLGTRRPLLFRAGQAYDGQHTLPLA